MSPPLLKMPKKTKQYGWQCSECDKVNTNFTYLLLKLAKEGEKEGWGVFFCRNSLPCQKSFDLLQCRLL